MNFIISVWLTTADETYFEYKQTSAIFFIPLVRSCSVKDPVCCILFQVSYNELKSISLTFFIGTWNKIYNEIFQPFL